MQPNYARDWTSTCEVCGVTFSYPDFDCAKQPGNHTVAAKTYYHLGGGHIDNVKERRLFAPIVVLQPDSEMLDKNGLITRFPAIVVHFRDSGIYETSKPDEQYYLDEKNGVKSGTAGREAWEKMYLTPEQQVTKNQSRLDEIQRQIREGNALLENVKRAKGQGDAVAVR
jgi:hypothetical protein